MLEEDTGKSEILVGTTSGGVYHLIRYKGLSCSTFIALVITPTDHFYNVSRSSELALLSWLVLVIYS